MTTTHDDSVRTDREQSLIDILSGPNYGVGCECLQKALGALGEATAACSELLSNHVDHSYAGTKNLSGDDQLQLDLACDRAVFDAVRRSGVYAVAASEETPVETDVGPSTSPPSKSFALGFDPLDGSSIVDANFTVGSIYGVWPDGARGVLGRTGREQVASAVALYGPRTTLCVALTPAARTTSDESVVLEVTLVHNRTAWVVSQPSIVLPDAPSGSRVFAPGNLRATRDNPHYARLVRTYLDERYTLRYTGGMVPDVCHVLAKRKGVFTNVSSPTARAKLRLLYEVAPVGLVIECAGGRAIHEERSSAEKEQQHRSVLDEVIQHMDQRLGVCMGTKNEVMKYEQIMFGDENRESQASVS